MSAESTLFRLSDGTQMCFAQYGVPDGRPVVMLHGNPGSRLSWGDLPGSPFRPDIRIIAPDRPGYGQTDFKRNAIEVWPQDLCELLDHLDIPKAILLAPSGGAPYALACAWQTPERFSYVLLFGAVGPNTPDAVKGALKSLQLLWRLAGPLYPLIRLQMRLFGWLARRKPARLMKFIRDAELTEADKVIFDRPDLQALFAREFPEAYRQNSIGSAYDATLPERWPIPLHDINSHVHIWHAANDQLVGNMPVYLHDALPASTLHVIPDAGHLWVLDHVADMLAAVLEDAPQNIPEPLDTPGAIQ